MIRRDILMVEIEALGKALGKILAKLIGTDTTAGKTDPEIRQVLNEQLDIDMDKFLDLDDDQIKPYLKSLKFMPSHLSDFSEILLQLGKSNQEINPELAIRYYKKTLAVYALMDQVLETISLDRYQKETWIKECLDAMK